MTNSNSDVVVTPEMIAAGRNELPWEIQFSDSPISQEELVSRIYRAMVAARSVKPD